MPVFVCGGPICSECGRLCQVHMEISQRTGVHWPIARHPDSDTAPCINDGKFYYMPPADEVDGPLLKELKECYAKS